LPRLFISHSSKDDLAAEAIRIHLVERGWNRKEIFLDFSVEGISAHERWKVSLAEANSAANAMLCLASPDWLDSKESQVEWRVAETLSILDPQRSRAVLVAILRDLSLDQLCEKGFGENQIADLSAAGASTLIHAELPGRSGQPARHDDVRLNSQALEKIERSLRMIGIAPASFEWRPADPTRPSPYPGLEHFTENDAGVFFGRESRLADALGIIDGLRRRDGPRVFTIIAPSGVGKSSFLRAGLWPRLSRQSGVAPLVVLRPGAGIISGREGGLIHSLADWFRRAGRSVAPGDVRAQFGGRSTQEGLALVLTEAMHAAGEGRTLILAIDQAEELFDDTDAIKATEAKEFLDALLALLAIPPAGVEFLVILVIRADGYDPLAAALARAEPLGAARRLASGGTSLTLLPLAPTAYRDVIRRPAQVALKTDRDIFEPALVDYLVDTFTGADALPLLAMTLEQLFAEYGPRQHITCADYETLYGAHPGAEGPVGRALSEAYRMAGTAGTDETLKRLLIPALVTWDPTAGEAGAARRRIVVRATLLDGDAELTRLADALLRRPTSS
jgi:TIR domain